MKVKISKDFTHYKEKWFMGLTLRQIIAFSLAILINIPLYAWLNPKLGSITGYIVMILSVPFLAVGFIEIQDMPFEKYALIIIKSLYSPVLRPYKVKDEMAGDLRNVLKEKSRN